MTDDAVERQIERNTLAGGKAYAFDELHEHDRPAQLWFQESDEGEILFVVFYTQACRWSRCLGCCLPSKSSRHHVDFRSLMRQVDGLFARPDVAERAGGVRKVILSNNGSMLDEETFSTTALVYLFAMINVHLPNVAVVTVETRPEYVDLTELEMLSRVLDEGASSPELEIAIGFEAFDDRVRNDVFHKGLSLATMEKLVRDIAPYGYRLKSYFMQKPVPGMTDEEAVADVRAAIGFLSALGAASGVRMNMHLNPTYVAAGTGLAEAFARGEYVPPRLADVARAAAAARGTGVSVFVGLFDEGLAVEGGSFLRPGDEPLVALLERFNRTQDFSLLDAVVT